MQPRQLRAATGNKQAAAMAVKTTQITLQQTQLSPSSGYVFGCSCSWRWRCRSRYRCEATQPWTWPAGALRLPATAVAMAVAADAAHQA